MIRRHARESDASDFPSGDTLVNIVPRSRQLHRPPRPCPAPTDVVGIAVGLHVGFATLYAATCVGGTCVSNAVPA